MFTVNFHYHAPADSGVSSQAIGDGQLLKLLLTYGPLILALFGIKVPPIPVPTEATDVNDEVEEEEGDSEEDETEEEDE